MLELIRYQAKHHESAVLQLWQRTLGAMWPINQRMLRGAVWTPLTSQQGFHLVVVQGQQVIGFVLVQFNQDEGVPPYGNIGAVLIDPDYQHLGVGRLLMDAALTSLRLAGAVRVQLGGKYPRLWPSLPVEMDTARAFFEHLGWSFEDQVVDLVCDISRFTIPDYLRQRMEAERITLAPATAQDEAAILALQRSDFLGWLPTYQHVCRLGDYADILVARDPDQGIVGALLMYGPTSYPQRIDAPWRTLLGEQVGSMGEVGVAKAQRGRGIGIALVAWGAEVLRQRGVDNCYISWTTLDEFYGRLGFKVWHTYITGRLRLQS